VHQLSREEKQAGWKLLFNGKNLEGWTTLTGQAVPKKMWQVKKGLLTVLPGHHQGCDIISQDEFLNFELNLEVLLTKGANSGLKYFIQPACSVGFEFQILDDINHPDAKEGIDGNRKFGSLYDLLPARNTAAKPIGEWNQLRLVVRGEHIEHWLNGSKVLEFDRSSERFWSAYKTSKFNSMKDFGTYQKGHLLLQDHGRSVSFRNIKIRPL